MNKIQVNTINLTGIALPGKTTNENGQSAIDCGSLWQKFITGDYANKIPDKLGNDIYAVYHSYEGDFTKPFSYFIGCKTDGDASVPNGMDSLVIPGGYYKIFLAKGKMPDCIADTWRQIWQSGINRAYSADFEVYGEKSKNWNDAEVEVFISVP